MGSNKLRDIGIHTFLLSLNFVTSSADSSLFVYSRSNAFLYFLVYVDYLIITGSDPSLINNIIQQLDSKFSTKDLKVPSFSVELRFWPLQQVFFYLNKSMLLTF